MLDEKYIKTFSKRTVETLKCYGDCKIINIYVASHDVCQKFIRYSIMNILTNGKWSKTLIENKSNKLQHTFIICKVFDDTNNSELDIMISKENSFICCIREKYKPKLKSYNENIINFNTNLTLTINMLLTQTIKNIGEESFKIWSPSTSCQDFTKAVLRTIDSFNFSGCLNRSIFCNKNNIQKQYYGSQSNKLHYQNIDKIFKTMPNRVNSALSIYNLAMKKIYKIE